MKWMAVGLVTCTACGVAFLAAQQDIIRSTVVGVRLIVEVRADASPVAGLVARDFAVVDAGVAQEVDAAGAAGDVSLAVLVDTSFSMRRSSAAYAAALAAARLAVGSLNATDLAAVLTVCDHATIVQRSTADRSALSAALALPAAPLGFTPQTALWDGIMIAASQAVGSKGVPVVLTITDGKDNASWLSRKDVGRTLQRQAVAVDIIGVETPPNYWIEGFDGSPPGPRPMAGDIAHDSGGQYFDAADMSLGRKLKARFDELRSSYVLTYTPRGVKTDDGWHPVTVRVPDRHVTVKAQAGYYAGK